MSRLKLTGNVSQVTYLSGDRVYHERGRVVLISGPASPTPALDRRSLPPISKRLQRSLLAYATSRLKEAGLFQALRTWDVQLVCEMLDDCSKVQERSYFVVFINPEGTGIALKNIELNDRLVPFMDYKWDIDE